MISFTKKPETKPATDAAQPNRFDEIRKAAAAGHKKAETDGTRPRPKKTGEDDRLL